MTNHLHKAAAMTESLLGFIIRAPIGASSSILQDVKEMVIVLNRRNNVNDSVASIKALVRDLCFQLDF